jgi:organic radical activating enzyme
LPESKESMTGKIIPIKDSAICPRRWNFIDARLNTNEVRICCHTSFQKIKPGESILDNDYIKERRLEMLQGVKHPDCNFCWKLEEQGLQSTRTVEIEKNKWDKEKYESLVAGNHDGITINDPILLSDKINTFNITLENTCDLKCSYCRSNYSTQWAVEDLKRGVIDIKTYRELSKEPDDWFIESIWSLLTENKNNIALIGMTGGEPSIIPNFYKIVDRLIDGDIFSSEKHMYVFTNGNMDHKQFIKFEDAINKITEKRLLRVNVSIDSLHKRAEYVRYGLDWGRFESNMDKLLGIAKNNKNFYIAVCSTMSTLSVPTYDKFMEWLMNKERSSGVKIQFHQNTVKSPDYDRPESLPVEFKKPLDLAIEHLKNALFNHEDYIKFLESCRDSIGTNNTDMQKFYDFYKNYDSIRGTDFVKTFPELADFYNACNKNR